MNNCRSNFLKHKLKKKQENIKINNCTCGVTFEKLVD